MSTTLTDYIFIDDETSLSHFIDENKSITWMGFDTEFIGEKRFYTLLCLIQISTENGFYLIDPISLEDLQPVLDLLQNPTITKLSHAGENDYRLLYNLYGIVPKNVFDMQIAAGFIGHRYPISFQKLVDKELGIHLSKGYTVSDWEARPMNKKQIKYALDDVIYLESLYHEISKKLEKLGRTEWVLEEMELLTHASYYQMDPEREALNNNIIHSLNHREKVFLLRLYQWRRAEAARKNYSKDMILQSKYIAPIVRHISSGKKALKNHRRIPDFVVRNHWDTFRDIYEQRVTPEEEKILERIPGPKLDKNLDDATMELLYLLISFKCQDGDISIDLVLSRTEFKKMKADMTYYDPRMEDGWRKEFLGKEMSQWLKQRDRIVIDFEEDRVVIRKA